MQQWLQKYQQAPADCIVSVFRCKGRMELRSVLLVSNSSLWQRCFLQADERFQYPMEKNILQTIHATDWENNSRK